MNLQELYNQYEKFDFNKEWYESIEYYQSVLQDIRSKAIENYFKDYAHLNKVYKLAVKDSGDDFLDRFLFKADNGIGKIRHQLITNKRRAEIRMAVAENFTPLVEILQSSDVKEAYDRLLNLIVENKLSVVHRFVRVLFPHDLTAIDASAKFNDLLKTVYQRFGIVIKSEDRISKSKELLELVTGKNPIIKQIFFWDLFEGYDSGSQTKSSVIKEDNSEFIEKLPRQIRSRINSGTNFWLIIDNRKWYVEGLGQNKEFRFSTIDAKDDKINIGDLLIVANATKRQVEGVFEVQKILDNEIDANCLYEIKNKVSFVELIENQILKGLGYADIELRDIVRITRENFLEIINTTELGNPSSYPLVGETILSGEEDIDQNQGEIDKGVYDKIPFHLDQVVNEDKLGRQPVAKAFADLIKKDVFTDKMNHSFIVHLQGEWGAGKSSFMNFIKQSLNKGDENWVVVDYNAWENQHISPPWWTLIDQVYRKSLGNKEYKWRSVLWLRLTEGFRRFRWYTGWQKITSFLIVALLLALITYFKTEIVDEAINLSGNKGWLEKFGSFIKLLPAIGAFVGVIYSFVAFITTPFFIKSSNEAKAFVLRAADPMSRVRQHFSKLVDTINVKGKRQLAIFIDDIDRCNKEFIVELLEGIQTLFKKKRVLFIVAGDKKWIVKSFGNTYEEFSNDSEKSDQLGENFLEKAFQLSLRMPNVSNQAKEEFWNHIIGYTPGREIEGQKEVDVDTVEELSEQQQEEVKSFIKEEKADISSPESMKKMQESLKFSADTVSNIVIEEKNKSSEDLKHLLQEFHPFIDSNPRSIIRLANNYTMIRSTLIAERNSSVSERKMFRWLIIEDLIPELTKLSFKNVKLSAVSDVMNNSLESSKKNNAIKLFNDYEDDFGGTLTVEEIRVIKGN